VVNVIEEGFDLCNNVLLFFYGLGARLQMLKHFHIRDEAIFCTTCTSAIYNVVQPLTGEGEDLFTYVLSHTDKSLTLHVAANQAERIKAKIRQAADNIGFFDETCCWEEIDIHGKPLIQPAPSAPTPASDFSSVDSLPLPRPPQHNTITSHLIKGLPSVLTGVLWMSLPFLHIAHVALLHTIVGYLALLSSFLIIYTGWEIFVRALKKAKRRQVSMDTQFTLSALSALILSWVALVFGITDLSLLFDAGLFILGFRHIGLAIEEWAKQKIDTGNSLLDGLPETVEVMTESEEEKGVDIAKPTSIHALLPGDRIRIPQGIAIPTDGVCTCEEATMIAPDLSGQTDPFFVNKKDKLLQGYRVTSACVEMQVEKPVSQSTLARMQDQASMAADKPMDRISLTARMGAHFVKGIFIMTSCASTFVVLYAYFVLHIAIGAAFFLALKTGLALLVIACPCTLGFIIPLIGKVGTFKCLKNGITLLHPNVLEHTAKAKYLLFDLNGTLTTGEKKVLCIRCIPGKRLPDNLFAHLKLLENGSTHLVGQAIVSFLEENYPQENFPAAEIHALQEKVSDYGMGLGILLQGQELLVGNQTLLEKKRLVFDPKDFPPLPPMQQRNYIAYGGEVVGYIDIAEKIRPEAPAALDYFRREGMAVRLCTGADIKTAMAYAKELGFAENEVFAGKSVQPGAEGVHPKVACIQSLEKDGDVIFVGDAGNDSPPIAHARVGVVVDSPTMSEASKTGAKAYIGERSLWPLVKMHAIAKQTLFTISLSLGVSAVYNLVSFVFMGGLALFWLGFMMHPGLGVAIMVGQALVVLLFAALCKAWPTPSKPPFSAYAKTVEAAAHTSSISSSITESYHSFCQRLGLQGSVTLLPSAARSSKTYIPLPSEEKVQETERDNSMHETMHVEESHATAVGQRA
jgi:Cu2+-exporting ATPase